MSARIIRKRFSKRFRLSVQLDDGRYWVVFHRKDATGPTDTNDAYYEPCDGREDALSYYAALVTSNEWGENY